MEQLTAGGLLCGPPEVQATPAATVDGGTSGGGWIAADLRIADARVGGVRDLAKAMSGDTASSGGSTRSGGTIGTPAASAAATAAAPAVVTESSSSGGGGERSEESSGTAGGGGGVSSGGGAASGATLSSGFAWDPSLLAYDCALFARKFPATTAAPLYAVLSDCRNDLRVLPRGRAGAGACTPGSTNPRG